MNMAKSCEVCGKKIDSHRICFDCMFDLAEEERLLRIKNSKWSRPGENGFHSLDIQMLGRTWAGRQCSFCWPFDCGCVI